MRGIEPKLVDYLDEKLRKNGLATDAVRRKDARLLFRLAAQSCVGIREQGGNNRGALVELMQETVGSAGREAWCMSMVMSCLAYAELRCAIRSPIVASEHCLTVWRETPKAQRVRAIPAAGAICIWRHGSTSSGHTGIVDSTDGETFSAIEGNTESGIVGGTVERDGGGVYYTHRSLTGNGNMKVVGFLKPF